MNDIQNNIVLMDSELRRYLNKRFTENETGYGPVDKIKFTIDGIECTWYTVDEDSYTQLISWDTWKNWTNDLQTRHS